MAYNFFEKKEYKIDWDGFYNDLMNARIFERAITRRL